MPLRVEDQPATQTSQSFVFTDTWRDLLDHIEKWRGDGQKSAPDPGRIRRVCQVLASVVNQVTDEPLRRVLTVLSEELYHGVFRDYAFVYDPRQDSSQVLDKSESLPGRQKRDRGSSPRRSQMPRLSEETITSAVPYFAVVQSLRDAAKDAIMRRLELEAKMSSNAQDVSHASVHRSVVATATEKVNQATSELQLREELRHARLLAETYQARTLELERLRLDMDEEVSRMRHEREKDEMTRQKVDNEVRRLRADVDAARAERAWHAETKRTGVVRDAAEQALRSPRSQQREIPKCGIEVPEYRGASHPGLDYVPGSRRQRRAKSSEPAQRLPIADLRHEQLSRGTNESLFQEDKLMDDELSIIRAQETPDSRLSPRSAALNRSSAGSSGTSSCGAADAAAGIRSRRISAPASGSAFGTSSGRQLVYPGSSWAQSTPASSTPKTTVRQTRAELQDAKAAVPRQGGSANGSAKPAVPKSSARPFSSNRTSSRGR